jgi:putative transposase
MPHTFTNLLTHVIFSTKERAPFIDDDLRPGLHAYMSGVVRELKGTPLIINGVADHVHLLVAMPPAISTSDAMRVLKTNSSRWVHDTRRKPFGWQAGYGAFSVSQSNAQTVTHYIANQEEHHRRVSFKDEFVSFLMKHGIEYDERFIWE